ncbi:asparagine synthase (glutamine-hydrolyzing) [Cyclobacterium xiamenense]|uniref:asparagine synthase (glutamine-hydrolyzing) n=1 Tax=Cyclobacterium xiamenense TaxID=1297121 RepID=UPI0012BA11DF|nr:asparagine synthase (glutamine-hydrolyzing) [Cyclobacterium xiamenense]
MCGLSGYFLKNGGETNSATMLSMLAIQRHRGPDDSGVAGIDMRSGRIEKLDGHVLSTFETKPNLVFGFNRLSILDVSHAGHQPMINEDANVALMMNGEVYNAFDFKSSLIDKGYRFEGNSDTEVVLNLYLEYGLDGMLDRLNGMFALAIFDGRKGSLYLIRDRVGIKPLYVLTDRNYIAFASEIKSFKALPQVELALDESKLSEFLLFRNVINQTLFKDIVNITPGTYWEIPASGEISEFCYYDIRKEGGQSTAVGQKELEAALRNSVSRQMISDVKLGCQLSGGVDSSLVTAFAASTLPKGSLETVSIVFSEENFSEKKYMDRVAADFQLLSHQFNLDASAYLNLIDEAVWHFEQPLNHPNTIGIKLLSREAKKHVTVLLSGEGADEALAGYRRFLPGCAKLLSLTTLKKAIKNRGYFLPFVRVWGEEISRYVLQTAFGDLAVAKAIYPRFSVRSALQRRSAIWHSIEDRSSKKKRKYELLTYLPDLLMRQDKMSMAHSIENRVPFLDNEMLTAAMQVDDALLIRKKRGKWEGKFLLKELCMELFDEHFAYRDKMGFGIPLKSFFSSIPFQTRWERELLPGIQKRGIFNSKPLARWMKNPGAMTAEKLDAIWLMVGFEIWANQYID